MSINLLLALLLNFGDSETVDYKSYIPMQVGNFWMFTNEYDYIKYEILDTKSIEGNIWYIFDEIPQFYYNRSPIYPYSIYMRWDDFGNLLIIGAVTGYPLIDEVDTIKFNLLLNDIYNSYRYSVFEALKFNWFEYSDTLYLAPLRDWDGEYYGTELIDTPKIKNSEVLEFGYGLRYWLKNNSLNVLNAIDCCCINSVLELAPGIGFMRGQGYTSSSKYYGCELAYENWRPFLFYVNGKYYKSQAYYELNDSPSTWLDLKKGK